MSYTDEASIIILENILQQKRVIALNDVFMKIVPCHRTSKLLSQLFYFSRVNKYGEFKRSQRRLMDDIGLPPGARMSLFRSMQRIKKLGIFHLRRERHTTTYIYKLDVCKLTSIIEEIYTCRA